MHRSRGAPDHSYSRRLAHPMLMLRSTSSSAFLISILLAGCGDGSSGSTASSPSVVGQSEGQASAPPSGQATTASNSSSSSSVKTDAKGRKFLGEVPFDVYDVFFDDPVAIIRDNTAVKVAGGVPANGSMASTNAPSGMGGGSLPPTSKGSGPSADASADWAKLIKTSVIEDETKSIRNELTRIMQSVGTYNREFANVQILGSTLAALAQMVHEHSGSLSWKEKALYVRDLAGKISVNASGVGREPYEKTLLPFEQIITILNGGSPPDLEEPDAAASVANMADREWLMRRMQKSIDVLKTSNQNEPAFKSQKEQASAELQLLAGFGALLRSPDYVYADEKAYQDYLTTMTEVSVAGRDATDAETYAAYQDQFNKLQQVCNDCHKQYRFE